VPYLPRARLNGELTTHVVEAVDGVKGTVSAPYEHRGRSLVRRRNSQERFYREGAHSEPRRNGGMMSDPTGFRRERIEKLSPRVRMKSARHVDRIIGMRHDFFVLFQISHAIPTAWLFCAFRTRRCHAIDCIGRPYSRRLKIGRSLAEAADFANRSLNHSLEQKLCRHKGYREVGLAARPPTESPQME